MTGFFFPLLPQFSEFRQIHRSGVVGTSAMDVVQLEFSFLTAMHAIGFAAPLNLVVILLLLLLGHLILQQ